MRVVVDGIGEDGKRVYVRWGVFRGDDVERSGFADRSVEIAPFNRRVVADETRFSRLSGISVLPARRGCRCLRNIDTTRLRVSGPSPAITFA
jgi:hypothetical protein